MNRKEKQSEYYLKNRDAILEKQRQRRINNPEFFKRLEANRSEHKKKYYLENKDRIKKRSNKRYETQRRKDEYAGYF